MGGEGTRIDKRRDGDRSGEGGNERYEEQEAMLRENSDSPGDGRRRMETRVMQCQLKIEKSVADSQMDTH